MNAIGLRAQKGGAVIVGLRLEKGVPKLLLSTMLATSVEGDRLSLEPYRLAAELPGEARKLVEEGRRRQDRLAAEGLKAVLARLDGPCVAALLVNRAGWITDLLEYSLAWDEHVPVAELLAVRDALRLGCREAGIDVVETDEKSLPESAEKILGPFEAPLKELGAIAGKPWRKEQKLACLAAWVALA